LGKTVIFNKAYIYAILPTWNFDINDALEYVKNRNWVYNGSVSLSLKDFNSCYHAERKLFINKQNRNRLKVELIRLHGCVQNDRLYHIDKIKFYNAKRYEVGKLIDMIHDLIGVKRKPTIDEINRNIQLMDNPYKESYIGCPISVSKPLKPPINQRYKKKIDIFNKEKPKILSSLSNAIENLENLQDISLLFTQPKQEEIMTHKYAPIKPATLNEAFSDPIDYTHSVYSNHTARTAMLQGKDFYVNYSRFCRMRELIRGKLWVNTNNYDAQKIAMDCLSIQLYNDNYESILADSMSA
jgi:hypothetical protein